jgi:hypothetical protein
MTFKLVYLSQTDPQWKNDRLGFGDPSDTLGEYGCALTSIAMLVSGHGYSETPRSLNEKMKNAGGFSGSYIVWGAINKIYPQIKLKEQIDCENKDAPLDKIDAALANGQPVVVRVDGSPVPGLQWHYVLVYGHKDNDYAILDPYPYQPGTAKEDLLMARYSRGNPLKRAIQQVLIYHCSTAGSGEPISSPSDSSSTLESASDSTTASTLGTGPRARVMASVTAGLNIRSSTDTSNMLNVVANVAPGTELALVDAGSESKLGVNGQWVRVRTATGQAGYAAAWFLENISGANQDAETGSASGVGNEAAGTSSAPVVSVNRSRPSMGDGLENIPLEPPADKRVGGNSSPARIWNKYGGLLAAISQKMGFDSAIAVAVLTQESGGQAYGADGRMIIRFENHIFYNEWGQKNPALYNKHFQSGSPSWTGHKWRPNAEAAWQECHTNQSVEWDVLKLASSFDDTAAKKSISMGLPQVMGFNFGMFGFASVQDMFSALSASERNQVIGFFDFVQGYGSRATDALKNKDFKTFASIYNGAGNAETYGRLIENHYNAFVALRGTQPSDNTSTPVVDTNTSTPTTDTNTSTPVVDTNTSTPAVDTNTPTPEIKVYVRVMASVAGGLNIRSSKDTSSMTNVVEKVAAGSQLLLVNPGNISRIGMANQWVQVRTPKGREGFAAAWFLEKISGANQPPVRQASRRLRPQIPRLHLSRLSSNRNRQSPKL